MRTFAKEERLKSSKQIEELVKNGRSLTAGPLRMVWMESEQPRKMLVTVAVSKRNFKRAVDRNKLKRRMREAWRNGKQVLELPLGSSGKKIRVMFFHVSKQLSDYASIESGMNIALKKLASSL
ncbi:MAG TPA: ribonuclease P protein component [Bacteroidia bacterium]|jgi:ribonuclease P protein component